MKWNLEELAEDCVVTYLKTLVVSGDVQIYGAWNFAEPKYPCAVVFAENTAPVVESADWHDSRKIDVQVSVITEAAADLETSRDLHIAAKTLILNALCVSDLVSHLNAAATADTAQVGFSQAQVTTSQRSVDAERNKMITTINIEVIADPVTGS